LQRESFFDKKNKVCCHWIELSVNIHPVALKGGTSADTKLKSKAGYCV